MHCQKEEEKNNKFKIKKITIYNSSMSIVEQKTLKVSAPPLTLSLNFIGL